MYKGLEIFSAVRPDVLFLHRIQQHVIMLTHYFKLNRNILSIGELARDSAVNVPFLLLAIT